jgi:hypothetical protein
MCHIEISPNLRPALVPSRPITDDAAESSRRKCL